MLQHLKLSTRFTQRHTVLVDVSRPHMHRQLGRGCYYVRVADLPGSVITQRTSSFAFARHIDAYQCEGQNCDADTKLQVRGHSPGMR